MTKKTYQVRIGESLMVGDYESLEKADAARIRLEDLFGLPCSVSETSVGEGGKQERKPFGERLIDSMKRGLAGLAARESQVAATEMVPRDATLDLVAHLRRQSAWSEKTFGPGSRVAGLIDHIGKELDEIRKAPADLSEWIDVVILALDGAWRSGHTPEQIVAALVAKQAKNEARTWPDWRTVPEGKAIEHVRDETVPRDADGKEWKIDDQAEFYDATTSRWIPVSVWSFNWYSRDVVVRRDFDQEHTVPMSLVGNLLRRPQPSPAPAPAIKPFGTLAVGDKVKWRDDRTEPVFMEGVVSRMEPRVIVQACGAERDPPFYADEYGPDKFFYAPASDPAPAQKPVAFEDLKVGDVVQWRTCTQDQWQTSVVQLRLSELGALCVPESAYCFYAHSFGPNLYLRAPVERWVRADKGDFIFADNVPEWVIGHAMKALLGKDVSSYPFEVGDALLLWPDGTVTCQKKEKEKSNA